MFVSASPSKFQTYGHSSPTLENIILIRACMMNSTARYGQSRCQWMKHMDKFEEHRILLAAIQMTAL